MKHECYLFINNFKKFLCKFFFELVVFITSFVSPKIFPLLKPLVFCIRNQYAIGDTREAFFPRRILIELKKLLKQNREGNYSINFVIFYGSASYIDAGFIYGVCGRSAIENDGWKKETSNVKVMTKSILFYVWSFAEIKVCLKFGNVKSLFQKHIFVKS